MVMPPNVVSMMWRNVHHMVSVMPREKRHVGVMPAANNHGLGLSDGCRADRYRTERA
jgi:hypothetical protein